MTARIEAEITDAALLQLVAASTTGRPVKCKISVTDERGESLNDVRVALIKQKAEGLRALADGLPTSLLRDQMLKRLKEIEDA